MVLLSALPLQTCIFLDSPRSGIHSHRIFFFLSSFTSGTSISHFPLLVCLSSWADSQRFLNSSAYLTATLHGHYFCKILSCLRGLVCTLFRYSYCCRPRTTQSLRHLTLPPVDLVDLHKYTLQLDDTPAAAIQEVGILSHLPIPHSSTPPK